MYQLAQLLNLGVNVIAQTGLPRTSKTNKKDEPLAKAKAKMGVRQAMAPAPKAAQRPPPSRRRTQQRGAAPSRSKTPCCSARSTPNSIDAIAGQVTGTGWQYYRQRSQGKVTGRDRHRPRHGLRARPQNSGAAKTTRPTRCTARTFVGMPKLVDSAFAQRALQVDATTGCCCALPAAGEVNAAVSLPMVQSSLRRHLQRKEAILPRRAGARQTAQNSWATTPTRATWVRWPAPKHEFIGPAETRTMERIKDMMPHQGNQADYSELALDLVGGPSRRKRAWPGDVSDNYLNLPDDDAAAVKLLHADHQLEQLYASRGTRSCC
jgi:hypothetical protein